MKNIANKDLSLAFMTLANGSDLDPASSLSQLLDILQSNKFKNS